MRRENCASLSKQKTKKHIHARALSHLQPGRSFAHAGTKQLITVASHPENILLLAAKNCPSLPLRVGGRYGGKYSTCSGTAGLLPVPLLSHRLYMKLLIEALADPPDCMS